MKYFVTHWQWPFLYLMKFCYFNFYELYAFFKYKIQIKFPKSSLKGFTCWMYIYTRC